MTQPFYDWLWNDIEIALTGVLDTTNPLIITKHSKRMVHEWFGTALSYDYGMITSDTSLAEALWRNLYLSDKEVPITELAKMVKFIRLQQEVFIKMSDEKLFDGDFEFLDPPFSLPPSELLQQQTNKVSVLRE
eukprot:TRINITY_DN3892_c0_g2_i9.p1 TRINITY_DN3892_c0_g2~~TRINITY_DN3892_c0_g2_i9.p1  ORF type:complete len:133 (+),score=38.04 TRINITY_DN3892_c0_g2_i9:918-1316(+)